MQALHSVGLEVVFEDRPYEFPVARSSERGVRVAKWTAMRACTAALAAAALGLASGAYSSEEAGEARYIRRFFIPDPTEWERVSQEPMRAEKAVMEIWEVSQYPPGAQPTPEQQEAADRLIERCERAVQKHGWENFQKALADGFKLLRNDRRHYYNEEYAFDDRVLDPEHPEFLMYYDTPQGKRLVGFMFYVAGPMDRGPQIGGPLTVWHYHTFSTVGCPLGLVRGRDRRGEGLLPVAEADDRVRCVRGTPTQRGREMLHVWLIGHPMGPFGTRMSIPPEFLKEGLEKRDRAREERQQGN